MELFIRLRQLVVSWTTIKVVSELKILTKASYFMLVFIPILAALWPGVRLVINQHNKAVSDITVVMTRSFDSLIVEEEKLKNLLHNADNISNRKYGTEANENAAVLSDIHSEISNAIESMEKEINRFRDDFTPKTLEHSALPWTLATAFFVALFVIIGHMLYQMFAPEEIRRYSINEYITHMKGEYVNHPSDELIIRAEDSLKSEAGERERNQEIKDVDRYMNLLETLSDEDIKSDMKNLKVSRRKTILVLLEDLSKSGDLSEKRIKCFHFMKNIDDDLDENSQSNVDIAKLTLIERAAKIKYISESVKPFFLILSILLIYSVSIYLIFMIVFVQAESVIEAAEWQDISRIFFHN